MKIPVTPSLDFSNFQPVSQAAAAAAGVVVHAVSEMPGGDPAPVSSADAPAPAVAPVAPAAAAWSPPAVKVAPPRFVGGRERLGEVAILDPVEFQGRVWSAIPLRRPNAKEVGLYFEALKGISEDESLYFPCFADPDGTPVPREVLDYLDDDDKRVVMERAVDFLPTRLLGLLEP